MRGNRACVGSFLLICFVCLLTGCGVPGEAGSGSGTPPGGEGIVCPEGYWVYDGGLFEQDAQPGEDGYQPYLLIRSCTEVWGRDYGWVNDRQKRAFDLLYGEYFSGDVRPGGRQARYFTLPDPLSTVELKNVIRLYEMATDSYGYRAFRYTFGDEGAACRRLLCPHRLPGRELHVMAAALAYEDGALDAAYDEALALADGILSGMDPELPETEKCEYIFRCLCAHTAYYTERGKGYTSIPTYFNGINVVNYREDSPYITAYGALKNGLANCSGYTQAFGLLARRAGLSCVDVYAFKPEDTERIEGHAWNLVRVDGKWYQLDAARADLDGGEGAIDWSCFLFGSGEPWHSQYSVRTYAHVAVELPECEPEPCPVS